MKIRCFEKFSESGGFELPDDAVIITASKGERITPTFTRSGAIGESVSGLWVSYYLPDNETKADNT